MNVTEQNLGIVLIPSRYGVRHQMKKPRAPLGGVAADQRAYMVQQYVAVVQNVRGQKFMVFRTGDPQFYLFAPLDPSGCIAAGMQFPVRRTALTRQIASALAHGWGNAGIGKE